MAIISAIKVINNDCFYAPSIIAIGRWEEVGLDTYLTIKEATVPIRNPTTTIVDSSRQVFSSLNRNASVLSLRMRYPSSGTVTAHPVARVFGRTRLPSDAVDDWQLMLTRAGSETILLKAIDSEDVFTSAGDRLTTFKAAEQLLDIWGCNEFLIGVEEKLTMSVTPAFGALQVRFS